MINGAQSELDILRGRDGRDGRDVCLDHEGFQEQMVLGGEGSERRAWSTGPTWTQEWGSHLHQVGPNHLPECGRN